MNVDVIVAWSPTAASVVKNATTTIPIVFLAGTPLGQGLVKSVARSGENVTGITFIASDRLFSKYFGEFTEFAAKNRLPAVYGLRELVPEGALMSLGPDLSDIAARGAVYVDKILKGAKPADLPVEQPTKCERVINLKTAKSLGLTIPQSLLQRADQLID